MDGFSVATHIQQHPGLVGATVLMLSTVGLPEAAVHCRALGVADYVTKPVAPAHVWTAIRRALQRPVMDTTGTPVGLAPSPTVRRTRRILVAEDNVINQSVIAYGLAEQGYQVEVVGTGQAALAALSRQPFDLVLMDVQMPELDGLETTARFGSRSGKPNAISQSWP
jgi:CheY-like chemotaxis protein